MSRRHVPVVTPSMMTAAILHRRQEWLDGGLVTDLRSIGSGLCYDFAEAVMNDLGLSRFYGNGGGPVEDRRTDDWWSRILLPDGSDAGEAEPFHADVARLRAEGAPLPQDIDDDRLADLIGGATHEWLEMDGLAYDAETPEGAVHFLLMPFFARQIAGLRAELDAARPGPASSIPDPTIGTAA